MKANRATLLGEAVEELVREDVDGLNGAALGEDLVGMRRQIDRLEAEFARRLRLFQLRRGDRDDGAPSLVSWLRHRCGMSSGAAMQRSEIANQLPELPEAEAMFRAGDLSLGHAHVLARLVTDVGADTARLAQSTLLEAARRLDPTRLRLVARHLRQCVDPDGALATALRDHARRYLHLSQTFDGVYVVDGLLDAEGGATLQTALGALGQPIPDDHRSASERRADALVELAVRQLQGGELPSVHGERPHLVLTTGESGLRESGLGAAEMAHAGPMAIETARRIACDSSVSEVGMDGAEPLSAGRARRTVPAALRRALAVRDKGCGYPGCDRPPEWTDAHHIRHWIDGGETSLQNLVLLCRMHHRRVHEEGWKLSMGPAGAVAQPP